MRVLMLCAMVCGLSLCAAGMAAPSRQGYSVAALYNSANAYAREGKFGLAVLNYQRAALLAPGDPDIRANLNFALAAAKLPPAASSRWADTLYLLSPTMTAWLGVFGILVLGVALLVTGNSRTLRRLRGVAAVLGIAMIAVPAAAAALQWHKTSDAIVIVGAAPLRVSPVPMGDSLLLLPQATTVSLLAEHEGFVLVRTRTGQSGWMASADVAAIVPRGAP